MKRKDFIHVLEKRENQRILKIEKNNAWCNMTTLEAIAYQPYLEREDIMEKKDENKWYCQFKLTE